MDFGGDVEFQVHLRVAPGDFVVAPGAVAVPLGAYEEGAVHQEGEDHVLQGGVVLVGDEVLQQLHVPLVHLGAHFPEGDPRGIDDAAFRPHLVHEADPTLAAQHHHMPGGRHVHCLKFHHFCLLVGREGRRATCRPGGLPGSPRIP